MTASLQLLDELDERVDACERELRRLGADHADAPLLMTAPGIAWVLGLDADEQARSGFRYAYSVYQAEYSRNLLFKVGGQMDRVFNAVVDRTRSRLDVPILRTLFGAKARPHHDRATGPPTLAVVLEKPRYDLTWFHEAVTCGFTRPVRGPIRPSDQSERLICHGFATSEAGVGRCECVPIMPLTSG